MLRWMKWHFPPDTELYPYGSEAEYATAPSRKLPTKLFFFTSERGRNFCFLETSLINNQFCWNSFPVPSGVHLPVFKMAAIKSTCISWNIWIKNIKKHHQELKSTWKDYLNFISESYILPYRQNRAHYTTLIPQIPTNRPHINMSYMLGASVTRKVVVFYPPPPSPPPIFHFLNEKSCKSTLEKCITKLKSWLLYLRIVVYTANILNK